MFHHRDDYPQVPFLRRCFPDWPEEKMREAELNYLRLLDIQLRVFEDGEAAERSCPPSDLTDAGASGIN
jgi:hypothetical protein